MQKSGPLTLAILTVVLPLLTFAAGVAAQRAVPTPEHPPMVSKQFETDKETIYAAFSANKRSPNPEQQNRAYRAAKEFVRRYGGEEDNYLDEARKFITDFEKQIKQYEVYTAYRTKKYAKAFELGRPLLQANNNDFLVLGILAEAGYENAVAGDGSLNEETIGYLRRAIQLVEAGKVSRADPFKSVDAAGGFLNLALGWFLKDKAPVEAAASFVRAVQPKSPYAQDALAYYRLGVAILKGEFAQLSAEYNEKFGAKRASPEQQEMFERIAQAGERAIDAFARSVALSNPKNLVKDAGSTQLTPEFRSRALEQLTALYKDLHNNSDAGLNELIAGVLLKPLP
jgi:hypothetical protein